MTDKERQDLLDSINRDTNSTKLACKIIIGCLIIELIAMIVQAVTHGPM